MKTIKYTILLLVFYGNLYAQKLETNGSIQLKAEITLGNQNQWLKLGAFAFGTINYGNVAAESGLSFASYQFLKRHTKKIQGRGFSYEFFTLLGIGNNSNLLGSSVSNLNTLLIFDANRESNFNGVGLGFQKDYLPGNLKSYGIKRGQFLMRFSNANHNIHLAFLNDFKFGKLFNGERSDYATTGSLTIGLTKINDRQSAYQFGVALDVFTPQPNYSLSPRNPINSDDGRKNVWFTLPPFKDLFYSNLYAFGTYQDQNYALHTSLGINSEKIGAFVQNILHDGLGLNPRFPWDVSRKNKLYFQSSGSIYHNFK